MSEVIYVLDETKIVNTKNYTSVIKYYRKGGNAVESIIISDIKVLR